MNRLIFEFREPNPNGTKTEQDVHLFCSRVGKFSARGLRIVRGALDEQIEAALKEEADNTWQNLPAADAASSASSASVYGRESRKPEAVPMQRGMLSTGATLDASFDPYDPRHYDASLREVKEVE